MENKNTRVKKKAADIKFGTDGWRSIIAEGYTFENLTRVTQATAAWLKKHNNAPSVMIGYDCRFNGRAFAEVTANVFAQEGVKVFLSPGFVSTPMVALSVLKRQVNAGVVITASHNPPEYSGFKIKGHYGGPATPDMIAEVEDLIPAQAEAYPNMLDTLFSEGKIEYYDMEAVYQNHLKENFDLELIRNSGIKVGYDAMYGAGQRIIRKVLPKAELLHCEFNPGFMGIPPEPIEKNLGEFQQLIRQQKLDVGLATDGDADRIGLFDENGDFVDSHHIILLLLKYMHETKGLSGRVTTTFSVTPKVAKLAKQYGLPVDVTPVGFKYICEIMLNEEVLVGGEESGGIAITGHLPERDGIYIGLTIMELMAKTGKKLTELIQEIYDMVGSFSFQRRDLHITDELKKHVVQAAAAGKFDQFGDYPVSQMQDLDGFKFFLPNESWVMIRPSGTEPVLRIYAEAKDRDTAEDILDQTIATILKK